MFATSDATAGVSLSGENVIAVAPRRRDMVLLVEDDEMLARLLAVLLSRCQLRVLHARTGAEGFRLFGENQEAIALVVMDCGLPDAHGGTLCLRLRAALPGVAVLLTSGRPQRAVCDLVAADGPTRFLAKPFMPSDVLREVRELVTVEARR